MNTGLRERIKGAKSNGKILTLLEEGKTYKWASGKTQKRWKKTAEKRRHEI